MTTQYLYHVDTIKCEVSLKRIFLLQLVLWLMVFIWSIKASYTRLSNFHVSFLLTNVFLMTIMVMKYNNYSVLIENCLFSLISVSIINKNFQVSRHKKKVARRLSNNFLVLRKVTSQNERMLEFNYLDSISNKSTRQGFD